MSKMPMKCKQQMKEIALKVAHKELIYYWINKPNESNFGIK